MFAHGTKPEFEHDGDTHDWVYVPGRTITVAAPDRSSVILPESPQLRSFIQFCNDTLHRGRSQINALFIDGSEYLLDDRIARNIDDVRRFIAQQSLNKNETIIFPYCVNGPFNNWRHQLKGVHVYGEDQEVTDEIGDKSIMHRHIGLSEVPAVLESAQARGVNIPYGYTGNTLDQLRP